MSTMSREPFANYLRDLGHELLVMARKARLAAAKDRDPFSMGRQTALYEVLSLMREQAVAFGLRDQSIGLNGVNVEELLEQSGRRSADPKSPRYDS